MNQATRDCPRCGTQVEDVGGYCLLGHRLNEEAHPGSLSELRAEVDRAFEEAKVQVAVMLQGTAPPPPPTPTSNVPTAPPVHLDPPAAAPPAPRTAPLVIDTEPMLGTDPIVDFAPAPRMDWGPERRQGLRKHFG